MLNNTDTLQIEGKTVRVYSCSTDSAGGEPGGADHTGSTASTGAAPSGGAPVVYLNMYQDASRSIIDALSKMNTLPFTLAAISGLKWDDDMTPWPCPPISKDDTPCGGLADDYLKLLTERIIPAVEEKTGTPTWRGIAGYSLGGLFALYVLYRTDVFCRAASMSGSLWYPGWMEYVASHNFATDGERSDLDSQLHGRTALSKRVYLSLGDKECATRNKYLKCVQDKTEEYFALLQRQGVQAQYTLNHGNHFVDAARRTAAGIAWIAEEV